MNIKYSESLGTTIFNDSYDSPVSHCHLCISYGFENPNEAIVVILDDQSFEDSEEMRIRIKGICMKHMTAYPITIPLIYNNKEAVELEVKNFQLKLIMES